jgi:hypothetical protein
LLKDIENANVLTGGRVFRSQWDIYRKAWTLTPCRHWQAVKGARQAYQRKGTPIVSAFAPEAADLRAPAPSLSTPMAQPTTAVPALEREVPKQEGPKQEVLKKEENEAKSELERVKLEA